MVKKECNTRAGVYKVKTFGTLHLDPVMDTNISVGVD